MRCNSVNSQQALRRILQNQASIPNVTCYSTCQTCYGPSPESCYECVSYRHGNTCVSECPDNTFPSQTQSVSPETPVTTIQALYPPVNDSLPNGGVNKTYEDKVNNTVEDGIDSSFPLSPAICHDCHIECLGGCNGNMSSNCYRCKNVIFHGQCMSSCPENISYLDKEYPYICRQCHDQCTGGCTGETSDDCIRCKNLKTIDGSCVDSCPMNYFEKVSMCFPCHEACIGCHGISNADCKGCKEVKYNNTCMNECPVRTQKDEQNVCMDETEPTANTSLGVDDGNKRGEGFGDRFRSTLIILVVLLIVALVTIATILAFVFKKKLRKKFRQLYGWTTGTIQDTDNSNNSDLQEGGMANETFEMDMECTKKNVNDSQVNKEKVHVFDETEAQVGDLDKRNKDSLVDVTNTSQDDAKSPSEVSIPEVLHPWVGGTICDAATGGAASDDISRVVLRERTQRHPNRNTCRSISDVLERKRPSLEECNSGQEMPRGRKSRNRRDLFGKDEPVMSEYIEDDGDGICMGAGRSYSGTFPREQSGKRAISNRASENFDSGYFTNASSMSSINRKSSLLTDIMPTMEEVEYSDNKNNEFTADSSQNINPNYVTMCSEEHSEEEGLVNKVSGQPEGSHVYCDIDDKQRCRSVNEPYYPYERCFAPLSWKLNSIDHWEQYKLLHPQSLLRGSFSYQTNDFVVSSFDKYGGHLLHPKHKVNLYIPPDAIPSDQKWEIYMHISFTDDETEDTVLSPTITCGPNRQFQEHIILSFPHCAADIHNWDMNMACTQTTVKETPNWEILSDGPSAASNMWISGEFCYLSIKHFTGFRLIGRRRQGTGSGDQESHRGRQGTGEHGQARSRRRFWSLVPRGGGNTEHRDASTDVGLDSRTQICVQCCCPMQRRRKLIMLFKQIKPNEIHLRVYILDNIESLRQSIVHEECNKWGGTPLSDPPHNLTVSCSYDQQMEIKMIKMTESGKLYPSSHTLTIEDVWYEAYVHRSFLISMEQDEELNVCCNIDVIWNGQTISIPISERITTSRSTVHDTTPDMSKNLEHDRTIAKTMCESASDDTFSQGSDSPLQRFAANQVEFERDDKVQHIIPSHIFRQLCLLLEIVNNDTPSPDWRKLAEEIGLTTECIQWIECQKGGFAKRVLGYWESTILQEQPDLDRVKALNLLGEILHKLGHDRARNLLQRRSSDSGIQADAQLEHYYEDKI
ncbi:uncharacterized protein LOC144435577 isoform X2 [Glandiceps talaboti]